MKSNGSFHSENICDNNSKSDDIFSRYDAMKRVRTKNFGDETRRRSKIKPRALCVSQCEPVEISQRNDIS